MCQRVWRKGTGDRGVAAQLEVVGFCTQCHCAPQHKLVGGGSDWRAAADLVLRRVTWQLNSVGAALANVCLVLYLL